MQLISSFKKGQAYKSFKWKGLILFEPENPTPPPPHPYKLPGTLSLIHPV